MKLLFGLGNPGDKFVGTRHNVGFMALDSFAYARGVTFSDKPKFSAFVAELSVEGEKVLLVKPSTFYNESGSSYRKILDFYKVEPQDTLIVHDELALPFGTIRVRLGGSDAGNNGIKSINQHGGEASVRVRVGTGNDKRALIGDFDFVLGKFSKEESDGLTASVLPHVNDILVAFITDTHQPTSITAIQEPSVE
jgi:PTH1 family peptidyl-tRNA hydrolase